MATLDHYLGRDLIADIAKGRYGKEKVMEIMEAATTEAAHDMERRVTEFLLLHFAQVMHYELGFGRQRLERYINHLAEQMAAFDVGAYDIDDMRQALMDDANNWKTVDVAYYIDALYRHFLRFLESWHSKDSESDIPHYKHMACNMAFICDMMEKSRGQVSPGPYPAK